MPRRKKRPAKKYARKAVKRFTAVSPERNLFPLQKIQKCLHRYVDYKSMDMGAANAADHYFSCNGLHDPDITGVGHSACLYDEMGALYNNYIVIGSRIRASTITPLGTTALPVLIVAKDHDTTAATDPKTMLENRRPSTAHKLIKNDGTVTAVNNSWSLKKDEMIQSYQAVSTVWGAAFGASPTEQHYYRVTVGDYLGTDLSAANVAIEIEYIALWTDPQDVAQSSGP